MRLHAGTGGLGSIHHHAVIVLVAVGVRRRRTCVLGKRRIQAATLLARLLQTRACGAVQQQLARGCHDLLPPRRGAALVPLGGRRAPAVSDWQHHGGRGVCLRRERRRPEGRVHVLVWLHEERPLAFGAWARHPGRAGRPAPLRGRVLAHSVCGGLLEEARHQVALLGLGLGQSILLRALGLVGGSLFRLLGLAERAPLSLFLLALLQLAKPFLFALGLLRLLLGPLGLPLRIQRGLFGRPLCVELGLLGGAFRGLAGLLSLELL